MLSEDSKRAIEWARDLLGDQMREDADALRAGELFADLSWLDLYLPSCFAAHYDAETVEGIIAAVKRVADKLCAYPDTYLATTAEELAAHALIAEARSVADIHTAEFTEAQVAVVERELDDLHEDAFEDHDVLMLFDPRFDGIEAGAISEMMGLANLHVRDWFTPFRPDRQ